MTPERATELIAQIDRTLHWTLRGGNDPNNEGNVKDAVDQLGIVLIEVINEIAIQQIRQ